MTTIDAVQLGDGRRLEVRVSGPDDALALVFHHGTPGARSPFRAIERAVHERGLRFVTMSRPGYGGSHRQRARRVVDVVSDTEAVLSALSIDRCVVAGWSGGGPHALACAARLEAARASLVVAGVAPYGVDIDWMAGMGAADIAEFSAALVGEEALRVVLAVASAYLRHVKADGIEKLLPQIDRSAISDELAWDMAEHFHESLRLGASGWLDDDLALIRPWGFELSEINVPVGIWQGSADKMVPLQHGRWLAANVPNATGHLLAGEGHVSIALSALPQMLDELVANAS